MGNVPFQPDMLTHLPHFVIDSLLYLVVLLNSFRESKGARPFKIFGSLIPMKIGKRLDGFKSGRMHLRSRTLVEIKISNKLTILPYKCKWTPEVNSSNRPSSTKAQFLTNLKKYKTLVHLKAEWVTPLEYMEVAYWSRVVTMAKMTKSSMISLSMILHSANGCVVNSPRRTNRRLP